MNDTFLLAGNFVQDMIKNRAWDYDRTIFCLEIDLRRGAEIMKVITDNYDAIRDMYRQEGGNNGDPVLGEINEKEFQLWIADNLENLYTALK